MMDTLHDEPGIFLLKKIINLGFLNAALSFIKEFFSRIIYILSLPGEIVGQHRSQDSKITEKGVKPVQFTIGVNF
jgi:hypothetical protein